MNLTQRMFVLLAVSWMPVLAPAAEKMNIILIMADDSAADNYGCYGSTFFSTPRLDALAASGVKFNHCYSEPVCTPSRVKIMTGRDGIRNYTAFGSLDRGEITFGTMMKNAGYATAVAGKWQLHGGPNGSLAPDCGFDTFCLWNYPGARRERFWNPGVVRDGTILETTPKDYGPDIFTDYIIEFIEKNKARPFFAYYPMVLVHSPFLPTPDSQAPGKKNKTDKTLENFRDMTAYADKCVGRIVDALEKNGLREKTVVIYTTDNGTGRSLTYPFRDEMRDGEKAYATDGGSHAPLIVNCPGTVPAGIVTDDLVEFSDMMPTLAHISNATLPDVTLDGRSFWPQCQGLAGNPRQWIFQYYYPKFTQAAKKHGQGIKHNEIAWAQNQHYKLYRDGSLYATADRHETKVILPGTGPDKAEDTRQILQAAIDAMPAKAAKLMVANKRSSPAKARPKNNKAALEPPNIVLVMTDDQGWGQTGYYNHPVLKTPNLDSMAQNGLRFDRFYAGAPNCSPTRSTIMTGRSNDRTGVQNHGYPMRLQEKTLPRALQKAGYATGHFGKWHLSGFRGPGIPVLKSDARGPGPFGFDEWLSVTNFFDRDPLMSRNGTFEAFKGDSSEIIVTEGLTFIAKQATQKKPFFAVIWYGTPHSPFRAASEDMIAFPTLDEKSKNHYGELVAMDRSVGVLRKGLRDLGIADNTLVWFCSDNGGLRNIKPDTVGGLRGNKGSVYEGGLRVPGIVEWPAVITKPRITHFPVATMDIFPTLAEIVELPDSALLKPCDGMSIRALFERELGPRSKPIPFRHTGRAAWIDNDYKLLTQNWRKNKFELYDLANDFQETTDIYSKQPDLAACMVKAFKAWNQQVEASVAGLDYPEGKVVGGDVEPKQWRSSKEYESYLELFSTLSQ